MSSFSFRKLASLACIGLLAAGTANAQDVPSAKVVAKQLYKTNKRSTQVRILKPDLIPASYQQALKNAGKIQRYYEAMAASPSEGLVAGSAFIAINHHSVAAAHKAAIDGCNAKKKKASEACVVVADFLPKRYRGEGGVSLSAVATEVFNKSYKKGRKSKAFAISPSSGNWGEAVKASSAEAARAAALADCKSKPADNGGQDCVVISAD